MRGATEAIDLVAFAWGPHALQEGDEIILSELEHRSNIVPWQFLRDDIGIGLKVMPMNDRGELRLDEFSRLLTPRTKLVAVTQVSNALGTHVGVEQIAAMAHRVGARILVDGARSVPHFRVNARAMDVDFFALSGHRVFGPTGAGALHAVPGLRLIGHPPRRVGSISLLMENIGTQEPVKFLDREGMAVRASHHCAQPALAHFGLTETVRPSLAFYNTHEETDILVQALHKARRELGG